MKELQAEPKGSIIFTGKLSQECMKSGKKAVIFLLLLGNVNSNK